MISIRNAPNAKLGLIEMVKYIDKFIPVRESTIIEIGSYVGDSTEIFAQRFKRVVAIDPWENGYDDKDAASYQHPMSVIEKQFDSLCAKYKNIDKVKLTSRDASVVKFSDIRVVYIDGIHTYDGCKEDIKIWRPKLKSGDFLCGHDYSIKFKGVMKAVDEIGKPDAFFSDTSWLFKIK